MDAVVVALTLDGLLLRLSAGSLRANTLRYVATDAWLGAPLAALDPEEAARSLAPLYLHAFGPARPADFAWWTGLPRVVARAALAGLELEDVGDALLLPADDLDAFAAAEPLPEDQLDVLPLWDAYTMGYAPDGRARLVAPRHLARLYDSVGNANGAVLLGGRAVAAWASRFAGGRLEVRLNPFGPLPRPELEERFRAIAALLGGPDVSLVDTDEPLQAAGGKVRPRSAAARSPGNGP